MKLKDLTSQNWEFYFHHRETLIQGYNIWYRGCPFPYRGYHDNNLTPNFHLIVLERLGNVKKYLFSLMHIANLVVPRTFKLSKYEVFLNQVCTFFDWNLVDIPVKDEEFSVPVWEIGKAIKVFLSEFGFTEVLSYRLAKMCMYILEFDNAYRWRAQDFLSLITENIYKNPRKEIKRVFEIYQDREVFEKNNPEFGARAKIRRVVWLIGILLFLPKVKKAFNKAVKQMEWENIRFTDSDRFHFCWWYGYDFEGKSRDERFSEYEHIYKYIPFRKKASPEETANFMTGN